MKGSIGDGLGKRQTTPDGFLRTQPLIRYELSASVLIFGETCACGRPFALLGGIQGRVENVLRFPGAHAGEVSVHPVAFHRITDAAPVSGWQVVQTKEGIDVLSSGVPEGFDERKLEWSFRAALSALGAVVPTVRVMRVLAIPKERRGEDSPGQVQAHSTRPRIGARTRREALAVQPDRAPWDSSPRLARPHDWKKVSVFSLAIMDTPRPRCPWADTSHGSDYPLPCNHSRAITRPLGESCPPPHDVRLG